MYPTTHALIKSYLAEGVFPGVNFAFYKNGQVEAYSYGCATLLPHPQKMTRETLFDIASLTKMIGTNSLILKLWEEGQLDLDAPVQNYLPDFQDGVVTSRDLLTHTSDINPFIENRDQLNERELKQALLNLKSGEQRGKKVAYTDTGTLLLGFLIDYFYQRPVQDVIATDVLEPLSMTNSTFNVSNTHSSIAATEYHQKRGLIQGTVHDPKAFVLGEQCGSAGLFSTLDDCLIYCQMLLNGGTSPNGIRFLKPQTVQQLYRDWTPQGDLGRSLGWDLKYRADSESPLLFHTGYTGTFLVIDPEQNECFVFLSNRVHPIDHREEYVQKRDHLLNVYLNEKHP